MPVLSSIKINSSVSFFTSYVFPGVKTVFTTYLAASECLQTTVRIAGAVTHSVNAILQSFLPCTGCYYFSIQRGRSNNHQKELLRLKINYEPNRRSSGFSSNSLTIFKNPTESLPSITRWSYERATYIIGRISTLSPIATGRF